MMMGSNSFKVFCNYATPESFMRLKDLIYLYLFNYFLMFRYIVVIAAVCMSVPVLMPDVG
jgi:hypothetical protein